MIKEEYSSMTVEVITPDGNLYYTICDAEDSTPIKVISVFGKSGTSLAAWAQALDILVNMLLARGTGINDIIEALSNLSNDKVIRDHKGVRVGSGPEGMAVALMEYKRQKYHDLNRKFDAIPTFDAGD